MKDPRDKVTNPSADHDPSQPVSLAPDTTIKGIAERALMAEALSPEDRRYQRKTDLEATRDMMQVINDRLMEPILYGAEPGPNTLGILEAPGQFPEIKEYPNNFPTDKIATEFRQANSQGDPRGRGYQKFVKDAITVATESSNPPVAGLSNATAWVRTRPDGTAPSPGPNFVRLGDVGGKTFFTTRAMLAAARLVG